MQIDLIENATVNKIAIKYHVDLKINKQYNISVTFTELLVNPGQGYIYTDIDEFPQHLTLEQIAELKDSVEKFIIENNDNLTKNIRSF